jgi:hypothetical protein
MRRKHLARLGRAPANCNPNCNRREPAELAAASSRDSSPTPLDPALESRAGVDPAAPDRPGFHGGVPCASCARKAAIDRQHQDRQLWLLARELCASAGLYGLGGRESLAERSFQLACTMLRDRVGSAEGEAGRD